MSLLTMSGVSAFYGPSQALFDVNLSVDQGEVVALMGRNGMGKSTTIKVICRLLQHRGGDVTLDGSNISGVPSYRVARMGVGLVPEGRRCFKDLTVYENLVAAARRGEWDFELVTELFPRLKERRDQAAGTLSGGEQQMLAIARALMTNPRLLLLDEATEGLAPVVRQEIWAAISNLKANAGLTILVVDKSLSELRQIADRGVILEKGRSVWTGQFDELTEELSDRYLGV
ncbi:amino acid/amide ABC transporter ATP-binding protein 2 (HAAT family) [Shimia isoporae]|uniref:Amino acid/amide ABC transporter ATP-binding protein 2 (HAAT family) n=1 Tax=Shimia isoporae TaxID=647720 RepID=A0A4R1NP86_9RHOB|nr:ABC transporter ATP-binding protein [Shimia isoporae]TCL10277.1 amino acid/amide ABC transporter ATP-binding protein 2 (HAAT family) [Shimia isoporae]